MSTMKTLNSRYGDSRKITDNGHGVWTIEGKAHYYRVGMNDDNTKIGYFDPEGGPFISCLLYTSPSPRDGLLSRMPSSA